MGIKNLPVSDGRSHAKAFTRLGWTVREVSNHIILDKPNALTISIPNHNEVKRQLLHGLLRKNGISEAAYLKAFNQ